LNSDKIVGYVNFDGRIKDRDGSLIGRVLSGDLAIGATILSNDGKYAGRLAADGSVVDAAGKVIGYLKNNGSYIDLDKKVAGYALQEVAKNRRN